MNKFIYIVLFSLTFLTCNSNKKRDSNANASIQDTITIQNLQKSFSTKNDKEFLRQFPKDFDQFYDYFGWDSVNDKPQELYEECNDYLDYWFDLINNEKYKEHERNIIGICNKGHWEADGVNYFQDKALSYIKEKKKYYLINDLEDKDARSVLFFLFDSPHPQFDADFASHFYFIRYQKDQWMLTNTIYKTQSSNEEDAFMYVCDVKQSIDISDSASLKKRKSIPEENDRDMVCTKIKSETNQTDPIGEDDISGEFELIKGYTLFIGSEDDEILSANIIIEKLSNTDYGYYSAQKIKGIRPIESQGALRNYKNAYYELSICDNDPDKGISEENFINGIYLHNQVIIKKKGDKLAMIWYGSNFRKYLLYKKLKPETNYSIYLENALDKSKEYYKNFLIEYEKAINYNKNKLKIEQKSFNDGWVTKHNHKGDGISFENTIYYQDPYQDGKFVKQDSIFLKQLYE